MTHTIRVADSDIGFACPPGTTILDAAQAAGYEMPSSCRKGVCGNCKGTVLAGSVRGGEGAEVLTDAERAQGQVLFCRATPSSDVTIRASRIARHDPSARRRIEAKVYRITQAADDVTILQLRFPAGVRAKFRAGQYLRVYLPDGQQRSFSMANAPHASDGVELHVRRVAAGAFSDHVLSQLAAGSALPVELPYGEFALNPHDKRPAVLIASGTGFAPIKSMLEAAFRARSPRRFALYWGARRRKDLYQLELVQKWAAQHANFRFVPVLSEPAADDAWEGRTGFVHQAVMADFDTLAGHEVYACGVPAMVNAARRDLVGERGLAAEDFHCDAFAPT